MHLRTRTAVAALLFAAPALATTSSLSTWSAANFRIWGYIPYWASSTEITNFATNGMYDHVSDVLYFGAVRPQADGDLTVVSAYAPTLAKLRTQAATSGFNLHLSMFAVDGSSVSTVWNTLAASPTARANFVSQLKTLMIGDPSTTADDIRGMNFDYERPSTATEWGNYTQLARETRAAFKASPVSSNWEVSVCDFGSTDSDWDGTNLFDANVYDQLMMMVYHIGASSSATWANTKLALTQQGAAKAFTDDQITIGVGTWGTGGPATVTLENIVKANPNLPYDATSFTGTIKDINGTTQTGTWTIESRKQVREKTQLALDRNMPGMFSWTLHYDALGTLGLHRVMHHYTVVKRDVPDLNLDGQVDAADASALASNIGTSTTSTGMTTAAQFDAFYLNGNWEKGDHDGNGFINQSDADWLAARYTALGVTLPDRLPYTGTFESFANSKGLTGRWRAARGFQNKLVETGNFHQDGAGALSWHGTGYGADKHSDQSVTLRNRNSAEVSAGLNTSTRSLDADLTTPINLGLSQEIFFTFLVRENTAALSAAQLTSGSRTLSLQFLDAAGANQFDFTLQALLQQFTIQSQADTAGQDVSLPGILPGSAYLIIGKLSGNGANANSLQASFFPNNALVGDFTNPSFPWMLTAFSSASYNPTLTDVRLTTPADANFTVSNLWLGGATSIPEPATLLACAFLPLARRGNRA